MRGKCGPRVSVVFDDRDGLVVADWVATLACGRGDLDVDVLDLTAAGLPDVDPCGSSTPPAVRDLAPWLGFADGFVVVAPRRFPSPVARAVRWCAADWRAKPVAVAGAAPAPLVALLAAVPVVLLDDPVRFPDRYTADRVLAEFARIPYEQRKE
jgi:hypothetical protein